MTPNEDRDQVPPNSENLLAKGRELSAAISERLLART